MDATPKALLAWAAGRVAPADARVLLADATGWTRAQLVLHEQDALPAATADAFRRAVGRRAAGEPVPYITGRQSFWGRDFAVTPATLIPRPDTETLVERAIPLVRAGSRVLDLGTGSGCIAITLALEVPGARILATDASGAALAVARANADALGARVEFRSGSWWEAVPDGESFDLVVSNPPYIHPADDHLASLAFEPAAALTDRLDGLSCIREIAAGAPRRLTPGGWLAIEHGYDQGEPVREIFRAAGLLAVCTVRDLGGNDRVTLGQAPDRPGQKRGGI